MFWNNIKNNSDSVTDILSCDFHHSIEKCSNFAPSLEPFHVAPQRI